MIDLSGLELGKDIEIEISGLRPGEKLYEELLYDVKCCEKTQNKKIFIAKLKNENIDLSNGLNDLEKFCNNFDRSNLKKKLKELVHTYIEVKYE